MYEEDAEPEVQTTTVHFRSFTIPILNPDEILEKLGPAQAKVMENLEEFTNERSGWTLKRCVYLDVTERVPPLPRSKLFQNACLYSTSVNHKREKPSQSLLRVGHFIKAIRSGK